MDVRAIAVHDPSDLDAHLLLNEVDSSLRAEWHVWDSGDADTRAAAQKKMVALLDRRRYISNLVRDVTETLGA